MAEGGVISNQEEQLFHHQLEYINPITDYEIALKLDLEEKEAAELNDKAIANEIEIYSVGQEFTLCDLLFDADCNDESNVTGILEDDDSEIRGGYLSNTNKDRKLAEQIQLEFDAESARQLQYSVSGTRNYGSRRSPLHSLAKAWYIPRNSSTITNQSNIRYSASITPNYDILQPDFSPDDDISFLTDRIDSQHEIGSRLDDMVTGVFSRRRLNMEQSARIQTGPFMSGISIPAVSEDVGFLHVMNAIHTGRRHHDDDVDVDGLDYEELLDMEERLGEVKFRGMSESEIKTLPECLFDSRLCEKDGEDSCSICMEKYSTYIKVRILKCKHMYHAACIDLWLKNKAECPVCRISVKDMLVGLYE